MVKPLRAPDDFVQALESPVDSLALSSYSSRNTLVRWHGFLNPINAKGRER